MRRLPVLTALVACGSLLAPVGIADAAKKKSPKPTIKRVTPMRVTVGRTLTSPCDSFSAVSTESAIRLRTSGFTMIRSMTASIV